MVVEQQNFSRAAERLNLSQPGVSLHIRNLENEFGAKLLHRTPKLVKMTEAGEILYRHARQILSLYEHAKQDIHRLKDEVTGTLKVGASMTIGEHELPRLLADYTARYPLVDIRIRIGNTGEIAQLVRSKALDLGLVEGQVDYPDLTISPYMKDELILIGPARHTLASIQPVEPALLQDQVWILREIGSGTRAFADGFIRNRKLAVKRTFVFNTSEGVKEAVTSGLGIAMLSRRIVHRELEAGSLCEIAVQGRPFTRDFSLIQSIDTDRSKAADMFIGRLGLS